SSSYQYWPSGLGQLTDFFCHSIELLSYGFIDLIFTVVSYDGFVGWNNHHIEFVDFPKFTCFCFCCTSHTGQLVIHPEVVLECNGSVCLSSVLNLYIFFGLNSLVQAVRIPSSFHYTAGLFVHYLHL